MPSLPPRYLDAVVSIEKRCDNDSQPIATGFLAGFLTGEKSTEGKNLYNLFLVTNRHVFEGLEQVVLRFNTSKEGVKSYLIDLLENDGKKKWFTHGNPKVDLAIIPINSEYLRKEGINSYFFVEENMAFKNDIIEYGISQGDEIFVLGFPMGITGVEKNYAIVRSGIIARLDDEILNDSSAYLIDSSVFPGNSGGPVILKPSISSIKGTKAVDKAYLIGVVRSYIAYEEVAISQQTRKPRIVFTENSGLAEVVPMDFVRDIARLRISTLEFDQAKV